MIKFSRLPFNSSGIERREGKISISIFKYSASWTTSNLEFYRRTVHITPNFEFLVFKNHDVNLKSSVLSKRLVSETTSEKLGSITVLLGESSLDTKTHILQIESNYRRLWWYIYSKVIILTLKSKINGLDKITISSSNKKLTQEDVLRKLFSRKLKTLESHYTVN